MPHIGLCQHIITHIPTICKSFSCHSKTANISHSVTYVQNTLSFNILHYSKTLWDINTGEVSIGIQSMFQMLQKRWMGINHQIFLRIEMTEWF